MQNNKYKFIDSLLISISVSIRENELNSIINKMNYLEILDILIVSDSCNEITYRWAVSAMWGEEGIIKTDCVLNMSDLDERIRIEEMTEGYYEFYR